MSKTFVGLLRGINVGGNKKIAMAELRDVLEGLGLTNVRSVLQSGNVVFEGTGTAAELEKKLSVAIKRELAVESEIFLRSASEWKKIVASNPFVDEAKSDPSHTLVMIFKSRLASAAVNVLREAIVGAEAVEAVGKELYLIYPGGIGTSKLTNAVIERKLAASGTARNWNTVLKLAEMV